MIQSKAYCCICKESDTTWAFEGQFGPGFLVDPLVPPDVKGADMGGKRFPTRGEQSPEQELEGRRHRPVNVIGQSGSLVEERLRDGAHVVRDGGCAEEVREGQIGEDVGVDLIWERFVDGHAG